MSTYWSRVSLTNFRNEQRVKIKFNLPINIIQVSRLIKILHNIFFCQDPNQKEDDLSAVHVKQGFINNHSSALDEFGSNLTKMANFNASGVWKSFQDILVKKEEANTFAVRF